MTTGTDIATQALIQAGVAADDQPPAAEDIARALKLGNQMLAQWAAKRWLVYYLQDLAKISTGAQSYTIGPGGDIDTGTSPRPDSIQAAYVRQVVPFSTTPVDFYLTQILAREDYARIALKNLPGGPSTHYFYESSFPLGRIYPWPINQADNWELHVLKKAPLVTLEAAVTYALPPQYDMAIQVVLARYLRSNYRLPPDTEINAMCRDALSLLRSANMQVPELQMPRDLAQPAAYNIYSDQGG